MDGQQVFTFEEFYASIIPQYNLTPAVAIDLIAMDECKRRMGDVVIYCKNMYDAADGADVFAIITEWR